MPSRVKRTKVSGDGEGTGKRVKVDVEDGTDALTSGVDGMHGFDNPLFDNGVEGEAPPEYTQYDMALVETVQGRAIKIMFDVLREIVHEIAVSFLEGGVRIECVNERHCVYASVDLQGERFEQYRVRDALVVGLHPSAVHKLLKCVSAQDTVAFGVSSERPTEMDVIVKNSARNMETTCSVTSLDLPELQLRVPVMVHEFRASIKSVQLKDLCRDLVQISETITISGRSDRTVEFCAVRQNMSQKVVLGESKTLVIAAAPMQGAVSVTFVSRDLALLTKAYATSPRVVINVGKADDGKSLPLKLEYKIGDLGDLVLVLAPCSEDCGQ